MTRGPNQTSHKGTFFAGSVKPLCQNEIAFVIVCIMTYAWNRFRRRHFTTALGNKYSLALNISARSASVTHCAHIPHYPALPIMGPLCRCVEEFRDGSTAEIDPIKRVDIRFAWRQGLHTT